MLNVLLCTGHFFFLFFFQEEHNQSANHPYNQPAVGTASQTATETHATARFLPQGPQAAALVNLGRVFGLVSPMYED